MSLQNLKVFRIIFWNILTIQDLKHGMIRKYRQYFCLGIM